jgi:ribosomal protein S18 acetylase RimI-like enzyme
MQARRGELVDVLEGAAGGGRRGGGAIARIDGRSVGIITWLVADAGRTAAPGGVNQGGDAEVRALAVDAAARGRGVGRALLEAAEAGLRAAGVRRAWLVTTNDNLTALALYQKAGWSLAAFRPGAIDELRRTIKPSIPAVGENGIPLRDELELTKEL